MQIEAGPVIMLLAPYLVRGQVSGIFIARPNLSVFFPSFTLFYIFHSK